MRHLPIPTFIRSERRALLALAVVSWAALVLLLIVALLGDARRIKVVHSSPSEGDEVAITQRELTVTFDREPDRDAVARTVSLSPPIGGEVRWRGRTMAYSFKGAPLPPGDYRLSISAGALGRGGEKLDRPFSLSFSVREEGWVLVRTSLTQQTLVAFRKGAPPKPLLTAPSISHFAVAPDGSRIAVVTLDEQRRGSLQLVDPATGTVTPLVDDPSVYVGGVEWSPDGGALLVVKRDALLDGTVGAPRLWLTRISGEFIGLLDPDGKPSLLPGWSPDAQSVAYVSPTDARQLVRNLSTQQVFEAGTPRGSPPGWSPDSRLVAFESVPPGQATLLLQPVRVRSLDGTIDRSFGREGESRTAPRFLDNSTLVTLRQVVGASRPGTDLVFESLADGSTLRTIQLTDGPGFIDDWQFDAVRHSVLYSVRDANALTTFRLNLQTGERRPVTPSGGAPAWLP
ncbi:MAG: hypothetical protein ABIP13_06150 [Tepidiformaceae bacterium]